VVRLDCLNRIKQPLPGIKMQPWFEMRFVFNWAMLALFESLIFISGIRTEVLAGCYLISS
jgi:hypothetical protein